MVSLPHLDVRRNGVSLREDLPERLLAENVPQGRGRQEPDGSRGTEQSQAWSPRRLLVVVHVVDGADSVGHPVVHDGIDTDCDAVLGQNLQETPTIFNTRDGRRLRI